MLKKELPYSCPACHSTMKVKSLTCPKCDTVVTGEFDLPVWLRLSSEDQAFILDFVKCSGSLKFMAKKMRLSYPTVRNILDDIIDRIKSKETKR